jgi:hypothetical protein
MEKLVNQNKQTKNCNNSWTDDDENQLGMMLNLCWKNSDHYGGDFSLKERVTAFKMVLEPLFCMNDVLDGIRIHMGESTEMVKPSHVKSILTPAKKKITQTEFIHAKEQHALEGYPKFGYYGKIIKDFERQERIERDVPSQQEIEMKRAIPAMSPELKSRLDKALKDKKNEETLMIDSKE